MASNQPPFEFRRTPRRFNAFVKLRPVQANDAKAIQRYASDPRLSELSPLPRPYPLHGGANFVRNALAGQRAKELFTFAILQRDALAGLVMVAPKCDERETGLLDYWVAAPFWNMGIATAAVRLVVREATRELAITAFEGVCWRCNLASIRVLEKNGFIFASEFANDGDYGPLPIGAPLVRYRLDPVIHLPQRSASFAVEWRT